MAWKITRLCADMSSFLGIVIGVGIAKVMDGAGLKVIHDDGNTTGIDVAVVGFVPGGLPEVSY